MQELIHARVKALYFCAPTLDLPRTYDIIHKHYLFEHFSDYDLKSILESGDIVVYNPGEALFHAGQPPLRVYIVLRGSATRAVCSPPLPRPDFSIYDPKISPRKDCFLYIVLVTLESLHPFHPRQPSPPALVYCAARFCCSHRTPPTP